jgi:hypothetical protein
MPAGDTFPLRERLRLRDSFGLALRELRRRPAFAALARGPWSLFIAIAVHWQGNAEAWPSQEALVRFSGSSIRAVRDHVRTLERQGFVRVRRERQSDGSDRLFYAPGPVTLAALAAFVERYPRDGVRPVPAAAPSTPPAATAGAPPAALAGEPRDPDQREPSSCETPLATSARAEEEQRGLVPSPEDREVAQLALVERMRRKHPTRLIPATRAFDPDEIAMVAACSAAVDGDREAKLAAHRQALTGAFAASKDGAPTVRFTWGTLDHFLDHVERGRRELQSAERERRRRERMPSAARASTPRGPGAVPVVAADEMRADLARIFGGAWKTT